MILLSFLVPYSAKPASCHGREGRGSKPVDGRSRRGVRDSSVERNGLAGVPELSEEERVHLGEELSDVLIYLIRLSGPIHCAA